MNLFLGIDPGSTRTGYGIVSYHKGHFSYVACGILSSLSKDRFDLLEETYTNLSRLLVTHHITAAGIEKLFFVKNIKTGIEVAQSRGVLLLALKQHRIHAHEYTPKEIKQWLTGSGAADKKAIMRFVRLLITIPPDIKEPDDAYDALAIALVTAYAYKKIC